MAGNNQSLGSTVFWLAMVGALIYGVVNADKLGIDSHDAESTVTAQANWIVGESKYCTSFPQEATDKHKVGYALEFVNCDEGPGHLVKVTFWGREEQPEYAQVNWKCVRNADQFTCAEQGGVLKELPKFEGPAPQ